mgnify:CR=1 FL=1
MLCCAQLARCWRRRGSWKCLRQFLTARLGAEAGPPIDKWALVWGRPNAGWLRRARVLLLPSLPQGPWHGSGASLTQWLGAFAVLLVLGSTVGLPFMWGIDRLIGG